MLLQISAKLLVMKERMTTPPCVPFEVQSDRANKRNSPPPKGAPGGSRSAHSLLEGQH